MRAQNINQEIRVTNSLLSSVSRQQTMILTCILYAANYFTVCSIFTFTFSNLVINITNKVIDLADRDEKYFSSINVVTSSV